MKVENSAVTGEINRNLGATVSLKCNSGFLPSANPLQDTCKEFTALEGTWEANGRCEGIPFAYPYRSFILFQGCRIWGLHIAMEARI